MLASLRARCVTFAACLALGACAQAFPGATEGMGGDQGSGSGGSGTGGSGSGTGGSSGAGGAQTGTGGTGPATVMKPPSTYTFNSAGAMFPYPQGHAFAHCSFPIYNTDTVATGYMNWKSRFYMGGRVVRPDSSNDTVSEGIAYGMLIGVYMNDKPMFDTLWSYAQGKRDGRGLMNWHIDASGGVVGQGSATDADEDMAWALLQAGAQWGGTYRQQATTLIEAIWSNCVEGGTTLKPGDNFGGASQTNPSYFAPSYYREFAKVTPSHNWMAVVDSSYQILTAASGQYGLVPNWVNSSGAGVGGPSGTTNSTDFGYDACRTPWRIALDYCESGDARAKAYLDKIVGFYAMTAPTSVGSLKDGYTPTGANPSGTLGDYAAGMAFFGPGAIAAMAGGHDTFLASAFASVLSNSTDPTKMSQFTYFNASWGILSLLAGSGNFWNAAN
jgi:endo-1,4-beta-D-glucanase Y